ncbi:hypothetical protein F5884DRAFT_687962, partial [Xylogone sp. PMI_703]
LLHRPDKHRPTHYVIRTGAFELLKYCVDNFSVVIWSSAVPANMNRMCKAFGEVTSRAIAIWGRDRFGLVNVIPGQSGHFHHHLNTKY